MTNDSSVPIVTVLLPPTMNDTPTTNMSTYDSEPTKVIIGVISPDKNCDLLSLTYSLSLTPPNLRRAPCLPLYALTTSKCAYVSSICPFISPSCSCLASKCFCDLARIIDIAANPTSDAPIVVAASTALTLNIITVTPINSTIAETKFAVLVLSVCDMVSTSLVTRLSTSPVVVVSK